MEKANLFGGDSEGIKGSVSFKPSLKVDHPFVRALDDMGFQLGSYYEINNEFSGVFSVWDARFIAEIPEKCRCIIEANQESLSI